MIALYPEASTFFRKPGLSVHWLIPVTAIAGLVCDIGLWRWSGRMRAM
jgi:hypothetical protein